MKDADKKSTWALLISIVALLLCLLVLTFWLFEVVPHYVITPDSFIGACVAFLGVIVTMAVGLQIVNVMELKSAQRKYEEELKALIIVSLMMPTYALIKSRHEQLRKWKYNNRIYLRKIDGIQIEKYCYAQYSGIA